MTILIDFEQRTIITRLNHLCLTPVMLDFGKKTLINIMIFARWIDSLIYFIDLRTYCQNPNATSMQPLGLTLQPLLNISNISAVTGPILMKL